MQKGQERSISSRIPVSGRIVDFLIDRCSDGYAEFLFKSDYDKDCPRFEALCAGKIPDVVPGVPITTEFAADNMDKILKIDFRELKIEKITKYVKEKYMNRVAYTCINYNDEEYAKTLLVKVKGISSKTANRILDAVDGVENIEYTDSEEKGCVDVMIQSDPKTEVREMIFYRLAAVQCPIYAMNQMKKSLEDVFIELTADGTETSAKAQNNEDPHEEDSHEDELHEEDHEEHEEHPGETDETDEEDGKEAAEHDSDL